MDCIAQVRNFICSAERSGEIENDSPELFSGRDDGSLSKSLTLFASNEEESHTMVSAIL
jgi:hypothetical protein